MMGLEGGLGGQLKGLKITLSVGTTIWIIVHPSWVLSISVCPAVHSGMEPALRDLIVLQWVGGGRVENCLEGSGDSLLVESALCLAEWAPGKYLL